MEIALTNKCQNIDDIKKYIKKKNKGVILSNKIKYIVEDSSIELWECGVGGLYSTMFYVCHKYKFTIPHAGYKSVAYEDVREYGIEKYGVSYMKKLSDYKKENHVDIIAYYFNISEDELTLLFYLISE